MADRAVDVADGAAAAAHDVVVVVADAALVAGGVPGGLDAAQQAGVGQRVQHVVDRLRRRRPGSVRRTSVSTVSASACGWSADGVEHGEPRLRDAQAALSAVPRRRSMTGRLATVSGIIQVRLPSGDVASRHVRGARPRSPAAAFPQIRVSW